ncbi:hypothetical protein MKA27_20880 [[Clostridium] innocuum]|nr:hypothetical protein [[Clostridium] innocuum]MCR0376247.1 hypothetical protein [[Clostridium] innocuum]MCR0559726.1 hypothetical protein [[Clostridium] innocuum]
MDKVKTFIFRYRMYITILFISFSILIFMNNIITVDYDSFFHYAAGEYINESKSIPRTAIYSWYGLSKSLPWISHEWLFDLILFHIVDYIGFDNIKFISLFMCMLIILIMCKTTKEVTNHKGLSLILFILFSFILSIGMSPRPQLFGYILTILLFYILNNYEHKISLWSFPLLVIIWVNVHGGSYLLAFVIYIIDILAHCCDFSIGKLVFTKDSNQRLRRRCLILLLGVGCIFLNGHGLDMVLYPVSNMGDNVMQAYITEWSAPDIKSLNGMLMLSFPVIAIGVLICTSKKIHTRDFLFTAAAIYLAARSMRFGIQAAIILIPIIIKYWDWELFITFRYKEHITITGLMVVLCLSSYLLGAGLSSFSASLDSSVFPTDKMIDKVKELNPSRMFNIYDIGGYLVYKHINVFIDGRADIYSKFNLIDVHKLETMDGDIDGILRKYKFDFFLIKSDTPLSNYLKVDEEYKIEYIDEHGFELYKKRD